MGRCVWFYVCVHGYARMKCVGMHGCARVWRVCMGMYEAAAILVYESMYGCAVHGNARIYPRIFVGVCGMNFQNIYQSLES